MVQTEISQLTTESSEWRQILRNYREEFHDYKKMLEETCKKTLSKDHLQEVEHYHNQFHIQLINIHDVKAAIKNHERKIQLETTHGELSEKTYNEHEVLLDQFLTLENTLQELRNDFRNFVSATNC